MHFNESKRDDLFGNSNANQFQQSNNFGGGATKSKRDQILEEKRRARGIQSQGGNDFNMNGGGPASGFNNKKLDLPVFNAKNFFQSSLRSDGSDDNDQFQRATMQNQDNEFNTMRKMGQGQNSMLTQKNVKDFNGTEDQYYEPQEKTGNMARSFSQPQFQGVNGGGNFNNNFGNDTGMMNTNNQNNFERNSQFNDSVHSGDQENKYSPVKRTNPNMKYVPTGMFVNGEGTVEDKRKTQFVTTDQNKFQNEYNPFHSVNFFKSTEGMTYQQELQMQIQEKARKKEEEKRKLKEDELLEEQRVKRELLEIQQKEQMEKDGKKRRLGDIMERYQQSEQDRLKQGKLNQNQDLENNGEHIRIQQQPRPIQNEVPAGAQYAQYRATPIEEQEYDYSKDFSKFDILNRGHRAAVQGVPKAKLIADIGHDLKNSIQNEVDKIRQAIRVQQHDFKDQLSIAIITNEAQVAIEERDRVKNHLHLLRSEMRRKREDQMTQENNLIKTLNKYQLEPQRYHYPQRHVHIEHTAPKPEEKKTIYEKIFFDKISNVIEAEKLNPPLNLYREATQNPLAQITIGKGQYYANSKGALNAESTLVTLDNKQLYPSKSLYELPDLSSKTTIVNWNKEPYEYYNHRVKDLNPRDDMYFVKNNYESKFASKIDDKLNLARYNLPEREEHQPKYDSRIRPIDLAHINVEKIHQVNEQRLTRLDRDRGAGGYGQRSKGDSDLDAITDLLMLKL